MLLLWRRALIKRGEQDGHRKVLTYVPTNFSQSPRILSEHIGIDTFLVTVSPMDEHGYFTFGTGNDYSSMVARAAKHLIVEVNDQMPRVYGFVLPRLVDFCLKNRNCFAPQKAAKPLEDLAFALRVR